jgi:hypothetical protein
MNGLKHGLSSEFVPEWCAVAALVLLDVLWAARIPVTFTITRDDFLVLGLGLGACWGLRAMRLRKGGLMAEYFALTLTATTAICVLSYLCLASSGPLVDARLMAMDRALGFDWLAGYQFLSAHPGLKSVLGFAYGSLVYQGLYFCVLLALMDRKQRMRDMFWLFGLCALFACLGTLLFPALGPSKFFNIETHNGFVPVMEHILSGRDLTFALSGMTGVVSFPSFHTAMALAYVWAFRGTGPAGWAMAGVNLVMLLAVPFFGGHYLMDMIAGAATMLLSLAMVKYAPGLWAMRGTGRRQTVAAANA